MNTYLHKITLLIFILASSIWNNFLNGQNLLNKFNYCMAQWAGFLKMLITFLDKEWLLPLLPTVARGVNVVAAVVYRHHLLGSCRGGVVWRGVAVWRLEPNKPKLV